MPEQNVRIGVVVIGRNEGERLKCCLQSVRSVTKAVVYVDSGSTDGSVQFATKNNIHVVQLDMTIPFSAGRARNEGFRFLTEKYPSLNYIQFIDGDCELNPNWLPIAIEHLDSHPGTAIVAGRRRERFPEASIYNRLCDIEWNTPVGVSTSCGGDFLVRVKAFKQVSGFNPTVVAGEEPELCYRLRRNNWIIYRLDQEMTLHDAAIDKFSQWWKRAVRSGHAYAQGVDLHKRDKQRYCLKPTMQIWFWGAIFPFTALTLSLSLAPSFLLLFGLYGVQFLRITLYARKRVQNNFHALLYAISTVLAKFPQLQGQILYWRRRIFKSTITIIEYNR